MPAVCPVQGIILYSLQYCKRDMHSGICFINYAESILCTDFLSHESPAT